MAKKQDAGAVNDSPSSAGHLLGQLIGDWYEEYFAAPLLKDVAKRLGLYLDSRFESRHSTVRGEKIVWKDYDENGVDYDFVIELGGSASYRGEPVGFFETFWRRGARHSKDKARDDSGKLVPMRATYPTARVLGIVSAGDFTEPARELVKSRNIELFYVPKDKIVAAWQKHGITIDYIDKLEEKEKLKLAMGAKSKLSKKGIKKEIANSLVESVGNSSIESFKNLLIGKLGAAPQEYRITLKASSEPIVYFRHSDVQKFLSGSQPKREFNNLSFSLEVVFSDGDSYIGDELSWEEMQKDFNRLTKLINHMENLAEKPV